MLLFHPVTNVEQALLHWQQEGLLSREQVKTLQRSLEGKTAELPHHAIRIFSAVGAVLVGLGVILFVSSNWYEMTPVLKIAILMSGLVVSGGAGYHLAYERKTYEKTGLALLFVNILIFGASIFLVAQIYHLPLTFWWGALLWFLGAVVFAYILQSRLHLWLSVPLLLLFLGWLRTYGVTGFASEVDFLFADRHSLFPLLPTVGAGIVSLGILHRAPKNLQFGSETLFHWGIFLSLLTFVISTADRDFLYIFLHLPSDHTAIITIIIALAALIGAIAFGRFETAQGKWGLFALGLYTAFVHILSFVPRWLDMSTSRIFSHGGGGAYGESPLFKGLFIVHILLVFVLLLTVIWYGTLLKLPGVINMGMLGLAFSIFIQYFSWAFTMLDRSIAFILGGVLILGLSSVLERKRRQLVSSFSS